MEIQAWAEFQAQSAPDPWLGTWTFRCEVKVGRVHPRANLRTGTRRFSMGLERMGGVYVSWGIAEPAPG